MPGNVLLDPSLDHLVVGFLVTGQVKVVVSVTVAHA